jgi:hypothetical protein
MPRKSSKAVVPKLEASAKLDVEANAIRKKDIKLR